MSGNASQPTPHAQVLIVDDEMEHADAMAEALRKPGHVCTIVHSLEQARDDPRRGRYVSSLILLAISPSGW